MKILFSHSYFMQFDPKQWEVAKPYPPLGTLWAAAVLREAGYEVALFDTQLIASPDLLQAELEKHQPDIFVIYDDGFNYLTKMCLTNMREAAFKMQQMAKAFGCKVIVSSSDSTDHDEQYLREGADIVIRGEAEMPLLELVKMYERKDNTPEAIEGLAFLNNTELVRTAKRKVMKELDALPLPAWDLADIAAYKAIWKNKHGYFSINLATTRGCPYKCNWCAKPIYGNRYNSRSPEQVVEELQLLQTRYGFDHVWFSDDIFGLKPDWVIRFADLVEKENLKFRFMIQSRADLLVAENYVAALKRAGCETVWMGAESGSQTILDAMDKGTTIDQIRQATQLLKKHQIRSAFFLQFGYLGETMSDIQKTIALLNELLPDDIGISVSYPLPGTGFYEKVKADLKNKQNWSDSDDLTLMFRNTYAPDFYKQLHRYVHKNYRKHQGYEGLRNLLRFRLNAKNMRRAASLMYYVPVVFNEHQKLKRINHDWN